MATTAPNHDQDIKDVLDFWFGQTPKQWFGSSEHDEYITSRFGPLVEKARLTDELDQHWLSTPSGSLAMIILLDQFTRNIFRPGNHPEPGLSWSGDAKALQIASESIAKGYDLQVQKEFASGPMQGQAHRYFFYMPFMHAEDLPSQVASCALFEVMQKEGQIAALQRKMEGKEDTEEDKAMIDWMNTAVPFATKHRDCVAAVGRFPKRNEPLGREHTEKEKKWLEEHPHGF